MIWLVRDREKKVQVGRRDLLGRNRWGRQHSNTRRTAAACHEKYKYSQTPNRFEIKSLD